MRVQASPTPMRLISRTVALDSSSSLTQGSIDAARKFPALQSRLQRNLHQLGLPRAAQTARAPAATVASAPAAVAFLPAQKLPNTTPNALRSFLEDPAGVTVEPAAFQLRCTQLCKVASKDTFQVSTVCKKLVVAVDGSCSLWKLNQIIAECFNASVDEFEPEPTKGKIVSGSCFLVSQPLHPGQCNNVIISSDSAASRAGLDDRHYSVAHLFRGVSTGYTLHRAPAEAAQQVIFESPMLSSAVAVSLDGIMRDSCNGIILDDLEEERRHSNGERHLPRIIQSSFLSTSETEAKNIFMLSPDLLLQLDNPWSTAHASYRRAQRKPLFRKDGADFDLCHMSEDEATDAD